MELMLLRIYQREIARQCEFVVLAVMDINRALATRTTSDVWMSVQTLLVAAANISKLCWGQAGSKTEERMALRDSLGITDESVLKATRFRNHFEHFDQRIEEWWLESDTHNFFDDSIGQRNTITGVTDKDVFRWLDPQSGNLEFWGEQYSIPQVIAEVQRIRPIAQAESMKPHWEPEAQVESPLNEDGGGQ